MAINPIRIPIVAFDLTKAAFRAVNKAMGFLKTNIFSVKGAIAGLVGAAGFGAFVKSVIETNRSFQSLEATLKTFLGSTENAKKAFGVLEQFASRTPFSVEEVVRSFNKMIALGLSPTVSALDAFGNVASGTGKTLEQFVEAAADAAVGEFERLKEFGVKARSEGDKVTFTFGGVETSHQKRRRINSGVS
jgi:phage tail tape-measure protein